jgi:hypothetical protein
MSNKQKRKPWSRLFTQYLRGMIALGKAAGPMLKRGYVDGSGKTAMGRRYDKAIGRINAIGRKWHKTPRGKRVKGKRS